MTWTERHTDPHNLGKRVRQQEARIVRTDTARSLAASSIGSGGVRVNDGADITVLDGGNVNIRDGGSLWVLYPSGIAALYMGRVVSHGTDVDRGFGLLVQLDSPEQENIFEATQGLDGEGFVIAGASARPLTRMRAYASEIVLDAAAFGGSTYITHSTTSDTAPICIIGTNGQIRRNSSALKYKQDVKTPDLDGLADSVLRMRVRTWRDKGQVAEDPETTQRHLGFIAEEAEEDGLGILVHKDPETGETEAFGYPQLTAPLVALDQRQQREINGLKAEVADLKATLLSALSRIDALEAQ